MITFTIQFSLFRYNLLIFKLKPMYPDIIFNINLVYLKQCFKYNKNIVILQTLLNSMRFDTFQNIWAFHK